MKLITNTFLVLLSATASTMGCDKKSASNDGEKAAAKNTGEKPATAKPSAAPVAKSEQDKAFEAWKVEACKCTDLTCSSVSADALIALAKTYPDWKKVTPENKAAHGFVAEGNSCKRAALKVK